MDTEETPTRWSLNDLLAEPVERSVDELLTNLNMMVVEFESFRPEMTGQITQERFLEVLHKLEGIHSIMRRLEAYSYLWLSEDTQNQVALKLRDQLDKSLVDYSNRILFFDIWFKELNEESANLFISCSGDNRYALESIRREKPFTLSEAEEKLINLKDINGIDAMVNLYEMITNRFSFSLEIEGKKKKLTRDELSSYYFNNSPDIRRKAYMELYRVYQENSTVLAQIYSHRVRDWHAEGVELRGYASPISARNLGNDLPDKSVDTLLSVCQKNAAVFQEYFRLKAGWLGMKKLRRYDIYAPLAGSDKYYPFSQAKEMVLDSFREFSLEIAGLAERVFDEEHIDPHPHQGKRGGAFCSAVLPGLTPWVLMNFSGRVNEIPTLAHELGHAIHAMLAGHHSVMTFHAALPLAETASVFSEMLLTDRLIREETNPAIRRDLLVRAIDDAYITVLRQAYFTLFERDAHRMLVEGCSFEELSSHYLENLKDQFGDVVEISNEFKWEWITVPHFYNSPFYTYAYSFGQLLVFALYQQYRREGQAFIPRYLKILSYGGSEKPEVILREAGLDISSEGFWQAGFDTINGMIKDLIQIS